MMIEPLHDSAFNGVFAGFGRGVSSDICTRATELIEQQVQGFIGEPTRIGSCFGYPGHSLLLTDADSVWNARECHARMARTS